MTNKFLSITLMLLVNSSALMGAEVEKPESSGEIEAGDSIMGRVFGIQGSGADIQHHVFELSSHSPKHAAIRSALVPGWGQAFNGDNVKGALYFVTTVASTLGSLALYDKSRDTYSEYQSDGITDSSKYNDYEDQRMLSMTLGAVAVGFYVLGIFDAHHRAYSKLYSQDPSLHVMVKKDESQIVWAKKF